MSTNGIHDSGHPSLDDLRNFPVFADLAEDQLEWLAAHCSNEFFASGDVLAIAGSPADAMTVVFEGELQARRQVSGEEALYIAPTGTITGKLPFSRMKEYPSNVRAVGPTRLGRVHESDFPEMLRVIPLLGERLVGVLSDRVREGARVDQTREKLAALGKLSAGLAHELNNPASAAQRSAANLREALKHLADANRKLATCPMTDQQRDDLATLETEMAEHFESNPVLDTLGLSDREEELTRWLEDQNISNAWEIAPVLAECGADTSCLEEIRGMLGDRMLGSALRRVTATFAVEHLIRDIDNSVGRISKLVKAVKEYSYMDQAKEQELDVHRGLETTLTMLGHVLKTGVNVTRDYDSTLPKILANGGELNQVWSNLIDNAIQAMQGHGELRIRTAREGGFILVEITDSGPGIPPDIRNRIFEPFFTTKGVGEGTGLGLEFVRRIVRRHHGDVRFTSRPGETSFQIRLPIHQIGGGQQGDRKGDESGDQKGDQKDESVYAHQSN